MELNAVLSRAVAAGASDVHLKLGRPPVVRRDGALEALDGLPPLTAEDLEQTLRALAASVPERERRFREGGEVDVAYAVDGLPRFRVNGFRQRGATSFAFRAIPHEIPNFDDLDLPPGVRRLAEEQRGLVLVTGASGAGKSTTLACVLDHINRTRQQHIVTIEDPIEFVHADRRCIVNQREIGIDTASFQEGLRSALRQDPDVILIGELRDADTAETALQAAESGHLVLSTMHTLDAAETIGRLLEFFAAGKQVQVRSVLAGVLRGVISQRLLQRRDGGRVPAVEVMVVNARIVDLIREGRPEHISEAIAEGAFVDMQNFTQALTRLVLDGIVDRDAAASAASNAHDFLIQLDHHLRRQEAERAEESAEPAPAFAGALRRVGP